MKIEINLKEEIMQIINERQTRADGVTKKFEDMFDKVNKRIDEVLLRIEEDVCAKILLNTKRINDNKTEFTKLNTDINSKVDKCVEEIKNSINVNKQSNKQSIEELKKDIELKITNINEQIKNNLKQQIKDNDDINKKLVETKEEILKFIAKNSDKIDQLDAKSEKT